MTNGSGLAKAGSWGGSEKGPNAGSTLKADHSGLADGLDGGCEEAMSKVTPGLSARANK